MIAAMRVEVLIANGDLDAALVEAERLVATNNGLGRWDLQMPVFDPLRSMPRFQQIVARLPH
jgi:hypothetical protein